MGLKRTPLYRTHVELGARMVDFAGWEMPVQYTGVIEEHLAVRNSCALFDVSHMGEIEVSGPGAHGFVQELITNDIDRVVDGQCIYTLLCYENGGVVDDCIVYRFNRDRFLFCVNASNTDKAFEWIKGRKGAHDVLLEDQSGNYAQLALQGPDSADVLAPLLDIPTSEIKHFHFVMVEAAGVEALVSRTGYTGEDGFEIYFEPEGAEKLWGAIMEAGRRHGIIPAGLGARDTLRLEMGYPLYGHELDESTTPMEAGLKSYVRLNKPSFIGKEVLKRQSETGVEKSLVGFTMVEPGIPRAGYKIISGGAQVGAVTSGTSSPSLKKGVGMGYIGAGVRKEPGAEIGIEIRGKAVKAQITKPPFYKRP